MKLLMKLEKEIFQLLRGTMTSALAEQVMIADVPIKLTMKKQMERNQ